MNRNKGIFSRILFKTEGEGYKKYIHQKTMLEELGLIPDSSEMNETYINIGDIVKLDSFNFKIIEIRTKFLPKTLQENDNFDYYKPNEPLPYNFQITYIVEECI
jgi:hypothetical protein